MAGLLCGIFAGLYLAADVAAEPLRGMLFLAALAVLLVPLAAACRWLAMVRRSPGRAEGAPATARGACRGAAEYLLADTTPNPAPAPRVIGSPSAGEADVGSALDDLADDLPAVTAAMIDALLHRDYVALAARADGLRLAGERLDWPPLADAAAAVADAATAADGQTATLAMMILVSTCQALARDHAVTA
ncbi:MAG: hypothetical protein ACOC7R_03425 [Planctomycetota bacterium]